MENPPRENGLIQWPAIWTEEWLQIAIDELEKLYPTPDERLRYETTLSVNAVIVRKADREFREAEERAGMQVKKEAIARGLQTGLAVEVIAKLSGESMEFVCEMQRQERDNSPNYLRIDCPNALCLVSHYHDRDFLPLRAIEFPKVAVVDTEGFRELFAN